MVLQAWWPMSLVVTKLVDVTEAKPLFFQLDMKIWSCTRFISSTWLCKAETACWAVARFFLSSTTVSFAFISAMALATVPVVDALVTPVHTEAASILVV